MVDDATTGRGGLARKMFWLKLGVLVAVILCLLWVSPFHRDRLPTLIPRDCTRLEVEYYPSVAEHLHQWFMTSPDLFNPAEMETLRSRGPFFISHPMVIESLSDILRSKPLLEGEGGTGGGNQYVEIRCYRNDEHVVTLTLHTPDLIVTDDGRRFRNKAASWGLPVDELISLTMREACAQNLRSLYRFVFEGIDRDYPVPAEWCDEVSAPIHREGSRWRERVNTPSPVAGRLSCYAAGEGRCHYAMNPNCHPNSPMHTVLLFETTAGWNQHGGAELFTFDNHSPRGGCVLLNSGMVVFVRTEEELKQLRWQ